MAAPVAHEYCSTRVGEMLVMEASASAIKSSNWTGWISR